MVSLFLRSLNHSQRRATVGRTLLDGWSVRRRDFYLTKPTNIHEGKSCTTPAGFQPIIPKIEWPHTHALDRAATGIGHFNKTLHQNSGRIFSLRSVTCPTHSDIYEDNLKMCSIYKSRISIYIIITSQKTESQASPSFSPACPWSTDISTFVCKVVPS